MAPREAAAEPDIIKKSLPRWEVRVPDPRPHGAARNVFALLEPAKCYRRAFAGPGVVGPQAGKLARSSEWSCAPVTAFRLLERPQENQP